jgi:hypothetical protein
MKTKYKYIHFVPGADETVWTIWNTKSDDYLGTLEYNKRWKEWESHPEPNTGWTAQCHLDVADFIKQLPTTKGGRVQPQVSGMPPDTEQILTEIFEHVKEKSGLEHEQSDFYKQLKDGDVTDPTGLLLMKWNRDILCSLHYLEKEKQQKFEMKTIINLLEKAVKYVKSDYEDFIRRHSR